MFISPILGFTLYNRHSNRHYYFTIIIIICMMSFCYYYADLDPQSHVTEKRKEVAQSLNVNTHVNTHTHMDISEYSASHFVMVFHGCTACQSLASCCYLLDCLRGNFAQPASGVLLVQQYMPLVHAAQGPVLPLLTPLRLLLPEVFTKQLVSCGNLPDPLMDLFCFILEQL